MRTDRWLDEGEVCACGHPVESHGLKHCWPGETPIGCGCQTVKPVLKAQVRRSFKFSSKGHDGQHALVRGVARAVGSGWHLEWINGQPRCEGEGEGETGCLATGVGVRPYGFDKRGRLSRPGAVSAARETKFLCSGCATAARAEVAAYGIREAP